MPTLPGKPYQCMAICCEPRYCDLLNQDLIVGVQVSFDDSLPAVQVAYHAPRHSHPLFVSFIPCSAALTIFICSSFLATPMKPMKNPMHPWSQDDSCNSEEDHAAIKRIEPSEQLAARCGWARDWAHPAEQHRRVQEGVQPAHMLEVCVAQHPAQQRREDDERSRQGVSHDAHQEWPDWQDSLSMVFVHGRYPLTLSSRVIIRQSA
jgi:hypothetical protein